MQRQDSYRKYNTRMRATVNPQEVKIFLEQHLLTFYPDEYIEQFIATPKDIYENRYLLRKMRYTALSFRNLVGIVTNAVINNKRFRVYECIKALCDALPADRGTKLEKGIADQLFFREGRSAD